MSTAVYDFSVSIKENNIECYDPRLSTDGIVRDVSKMTLTAYTERFHIAQSLCDFITSHASTPPRVLIRCRGTHHDPYEATAPDGRVDQEDVDFEFYLDIAEYLITGNPVSWVIGEGSPAYRGGMSLQVDVPDLAGDDIEMGQFSNSKYTRRCSTLAERDESRQRVELLEAAGLPPWVRSAKQPWGTVAGIEGNFPLGEFEDSLYIDEGGIDQTRPFVRPPFKGLYDWANEYCQSRNLLKEFRVRKDIHGWALPALRKEIEAILREYKPAGCMRVTTALKFRGQDIVVRTPSVLWRVFGERPLWLTLVLWFTLIYPFIILPLRYMIEGRYQVAGISFAFQEWVHLDTSSPGDAASEYSSEAPTVYNEMTRNDLRMGLALKTTSRGASRMIGIRRQDFLKQWVGEIATRSSSGYQCKLPLILTTASARPSQAEC